MRTSRVRQRVPYEQRLALDRAIIERGPGRETLEKIYRAFELQARYGISLRAFQRYARWIEQQGRDYFLATLLGPVLGRLDGADRARIHEAAQNLLAGLVVRAARAQQEAPSIEELAKLVRLNLDLRKAAAIELAAGASAAQQKSEEPGRLPAGFVENVRRLYGVELEQAVRAGGGEAQRQGEQRGAERQ